MRFARLILTAVLAAPLLAGLLLAVKFVSVPTSAFDRDASLAMSERAVGNPLWLIVPSLGITADVENVGVAPDGSMDVPKEWENVGWFENGPKPGAKGNAVIAGHFDSDTGPAVFWKLKQLKPGDEVRVIDDRNRLHVFTVHETQRFADDATALGEIFGQTDKMRLTLITCGGKWNDKEERYEERLAVFAELIPS